MQDYWEKEDHRKGRCGEVAYFEVRSAPGRRRWRLVSLGWLAGVPQWQVALFLLRCIGMAGYGRLWQVWAGLGRFGRVGFACGRKGKGAKEQRRNEAKISGGAESGGLPGIGWTDCQRTFPRWARSLHISGGALRDLALGWRSAGGKVAMLGREWGRSILFLVAGRCARRTGRIKGLRTFDRFCWGRWSASGCLAVPDVAVGRRKI